MRYPAPLMAVSMRDDVIKAKSNYIRCKDATAVLPLYEIHEIRFTKFCCVERRAIRQQLRGFSFTRDCTLDF